MQIIVLLFTIGCVVAQAEEYQYRYGGQAPSPVDSCISTALMSSCHNQFNMMSEAHTYGGGSNFGEICSTASKFLDCVIDYAGNSCNDVSANEIKLSSTFAPMGRMAMRIISMAPEECGAFSTKFDSTMTQPQVTEHRTVNYH